MYRTTLFEYEYKCTITDILKSILSAREGSSAGMRRRLIVCRKCLRTAKIRARKLSLKAGAVIAGAVCPTLGQGVAQAVEFANHIWKSTSNGGAHYVIPSRCSPEWSPSARLLRCAQSPSCDPPANLRALLPAVGWRGVLPGPFRRHVALRQGGRIYRGPGQGGIHSGARS